MSIKPPTAITTPDNILTLLNEQLKDAEVEHFFVVVLDIKLRPIKVVCISKGAVDNCAVDMREVFRPMIVERGSNLIVAHNHPSGDPTPSNMDVELTQRIRKGAVLLDLNFLDHLIIPTGKYALKGNYYSFAEHGQ